MVLALTRHAGAGRHPSDPPQLDTDLRRYDGPHVTIPQGDIPRVTIFDGEHEDHEVWKISYPNPSCPEPVLSLAEGCLRGESVFFNAHSNLPTVAQNIYTAGGNYQLE